MYWFAWIWKELTKPLTSDYWIFQTTRILDIIMFHVGILQHPETLSYIDFHKIKKDQKQRCYFIIQGNYSWLSNFHESYRQVTLMSPSTWLLPSQYLHLVLPSLTLGPASGDEGEFVALPLCIQGPVAVMELLMLQLEYLSFTSRNLVPPSTFLKTGRPELHLPTSNL